MIPIPTSNSKHDPEIRSGFGRPRSQNQLTMMDGNFPLSTYIGYPKKDGAMINDIRAI